MGIEIGILLARFRPFESMLRSKIVRTMVKMILKEIAWTPNRT